METKEMTQNKPTKNPLFQRAERIGIAFLEHRVKDESKYYEITGFEMDRPNKAGELNSFIKATDLETGEDGMIFIDGGLKAKITAAGGPDKLLNRKIELIWRGQVAATVTDEKGKELETKVNNYDMYFLANA